MKRPILNEVSITDVKEELMNETPGITFTIDPGQWNFFLQSAYDFGATLVEVDQKKRPVKAYRRMVSA